LDQFFQESGTADDKGFGDRGRPEGQDLETLVIEKEGRTRTKEEGGEIEEKCIK
jgi:hypothetical protein